MSALVRVEPSRLRRRASGGKEGDIVASYSADLIAESQSRIRTPFSWQGAFYVTVSMWGGSGAETARAYRLTPRRLFPGRVTDYTNKVLSDHGARARQDPRGFYHGMVVRSKGAAYVLTGPELRFTDGACAGPQQWLWAAPEGEVA